MLSSHSFSIPTGALLLALAGLLPFIGSAAAIVFLALRGEPIAFAGGVLVAYSAVILSFLGGVRWGVEMMAGVLAGPRFWLLSGSVVGSLAGWAAVLFWAYGDPISHTFLVLALLFAAHWAWDVFFERDAPGWFAGLRTIATAGAVASLLASWLVFVATGDPGSP